MKIIIVDSLVTPDTSGYADKISVWKDDTSGELVYHSAASCCPNPTKPNTTLRWDACYAWIDCGEYTWDCRTTPKHGKCLALNDMGKVTTRNANFNHNKEFWAESVLIHEGYADNWRGSMCCLTLPPEIWTDFIALFELGEHGILKIIDKTTGV